MTHAEATTERDRLMRNYTGVTARVARSGATWGVSLHDARASERKDSTQRQLLVFAPVPPLSSGAAIAWSPVQTVQTAVQTAYP